MPFRFALGCGTWKGGWSMRLVYYSLANFSHDSRVQQWMQSIRSLRRYSPSVPVWLFLFNERSPELECEADRHGVHLHFLGDYREFLERVHAQGSVLALYPTFHKFLVLPHLPLPALSQLLYLDCDTFFFDDVNLIFDRHMEHDLYAREEPASRQSRLGYDPNHVDEEKLKAIARREGMRYVAPFNSGVCLLNHGIWQSLIRLRDAYLGLAWRLLCGWARRSDAGDSLRLQSVRHRTTELDRSRALAYPAADDWIVEQIALWLALGGIPDFSLGTLSPRQVLEGAEFEAVVPSGQRCVLAHYFTGGEQNFFSLVTALAA
jgi:hypothetical protein